MLQLRLGQISADKMFQKSLLPVGGPVCCRQGRMQANTVNEADDRVSQLGNIDRIGQFPIVLQTSQVRARFLAQVPISKRVQMAHVSVVNSGANEIDPCPPIIPPLPIDRQQRYQIRDIGITALASLRVVGRLPGHRANDLLKREAQQCILVLKIVRKHAGRAAHFLGNFAHRGAFQAITNNHTPGRVCDLNPSIMQWHGVRAPTIMKRGSTHLHPL